MLSLFRFLADGLFGVDSLRHVAFSKADEQHSGRDGNIPNREQ